MFKLAENQTFRHVVNIRVPTDGDYDTQSIGVTYRILTEDKLADLDTSSGAGQNAFLKAVIKDIDDVVDENDKPLEFNDQLLAKLTSLTYVRLALLAGYTKAMTLGRLGN
jgi:hypothetical protein